MSSERDPRAALFSEANRCRGGIASRNGGPRDPRSRGRRRDGIGSLARAADGVSPPGDLLAASSRTRAGGRGHQVQMRCRARLDRILGQPCFPGFFLLFPRARLAFRRDPKLEFGRRLRRPAREGGRSNLPESPLGFVERPYPRRFLPPGQKSILLNAMTGNDNNSSNNNNNNNGDSIMLFLYISHK